MRVELSAGALRAPVWPAGIAARGFRPGDGPSLHALLQHGYRRGFGSVARKDVAVRESWRRRGLGRRFSATRSPRSPRAGPSAST
jgi:hypothetical protein